jgi:cytidine deaminase
MFDYCPDAHVYVYRPAPGECPDGTVAGSADASEPPGRVQRLTVAELLPGRTRRLW